MKQDQRGGIGSTNIQVANVSVGLSYEDVKSIAKEVFEANFAKLRSVAADVASKRAEELREEFVSALANGRGETKSFDQPEKQVALLEAQKSYAVSGDEELKRLLVEMVLSISREPERSLKSIVLHEALKVIPNLTDFQLRILAVVFVIRFVIFNNCNNILELFSRYVTFIGPDISFEEDLGRNLRHLQYCGCITFSELSSASMHHVLTNVYPGFVSSGYSVDELQEAFGADGFPPGGIMPCLRDSAKFQIAAINETVLNTKSAGWSKPQHDIALQKLKDKLIDAASLQAEIEILGDTQKELLNFWDKASGLSHVTLTSVGMAVAHTFVSRERNFDAPLDIWI